MMIFSPRTLQKVYSSLLAATSRGTVEDEGDLASDTCRKARYASTIGGTKVLR